MQRWYLKVCVLCAIVLVTNCIPATATQLTEGANTKQITYQDLIALSRRASRVLSYVDNQFLYEQEIRSVRETAESLIGSELIWRVAIERVTQSEVIYALVPAGGTLVVIQPGAGSDQPDSEHAKHHLFMGPPSALLGNLLSAPKTLRIGRAISVDMARQLRRGDFIYLIGRVQQVDPPKFSNSLYANIVHIGDVTHHILTEEQP